MRKDLFDTLFDWAEEVTGWMFEKDLFKNWFNIISWTGLTSALYVLFLKTESTIFGIISLLSFVLIFFYGWHTVMHILSERDKEAGTTKKLISFVLAIGPGQPHECSLINHATKTCS